MVDKMDRSDDEIADSIEKKVKEVRRRRALSGAASKLEKQRRHIRVTFNVSVAEEGAQQLVEEQARQALANTADGKVNRSRLLRAAWKVFAALPFDEQMVAIKSIDVPRLGRPDGAKTGMGVSGAP